jgi:predicted tellurium resistance membrane protein TerC
MVIRLVTLVIQDIFLVKVLLVALNVRFDITLQAELVDVLNVQLELIHQYLGLQYVTNALLDISLNLAQALVLNALLEKLQNRAQVYALIYAILDIIIIGEIVIFVQQEHIQLQIFQNVLIAKGVHLRVKERQLAKNVQEEHFHLLLELHFVKIAPLVLIQTLEHFHV